jgi:hypothetical protein
MSRCATAWQRRPRRQRPRSPGPEESENIESEKNYFKIWFRKEQNRRQKLMARKPERILKVWQTTTSTALFG